MFKNKDEELKMFKLLEELDLFSYYWINYDEWQICFDAWNIIVFNTSLESKETKYEFSLQDILRLHSLKKILNNL